MSLFGCKHPFAALTLYSGPKETSRDADFSKHQIVLLCACGERVTLRWAECIGGVDAFIERGAAAHGVPAFDATKPCILKTADPTRTYCERCKNPHHKCDGAGVGVLDGEVVSPETPSPAREGGN